MNATTLLAAALAVTFLGFGAAKLLALPSMRARAAHVGFSVAAYRGIGALEIAGAAGLLLGAVAPGVCALAALGLLLLLVGAVVTHLRNRDGLKGAAPALVLAILLVVLLVVDVHALR